jgi:hypothetical protein
MRSLISILLFFILSVSNNAQETLVYIESNKQDSKIFINDDLVGSGNVVVKLEPGEYEIKVREDKLKWNSQIFIDRIEIERNSKNLKLNYKFIDPIILKTIPDDSQIFAGDSLLGNSPLLLSSEFSDLTIKKNNFADKNIILNEAAVNKPIELKFIGEEKNGRFVGSKLFWGLITSAVALGTTAAYYKIKADKNYDKYLDTGKKDFLDETDRQDLFSGVSFGALQLNLGFLLYLILDE